MASSALAPAAYECVVLPGAFVLSEATVQKLNSFVERAE